MRQDKRHIMRTIFTLIAASGALGLGACSVLTSTTNTAARTAEALGEAVTKGSQTSTNASITEPDMPRYASARVYVASQLPMIRREAAVGGGENLRALAALMHQDDPRAFGQWMQANYGELFSDLSEPEMLVTRIAARRG